jgi:hypothetical protein
MVAELVKQHLDWITLRRGDLHALPRPAISAVEQLPACSDAGSQALREWLDAAGIEVGALFRPIDKAGTSPYLSIRRKYRQGVCRASRLRCQHVFRSLTAGRLPDLCGWQGRVNHAGAGLL